MMNLPLTSNKTLVPNMDINAELNGANAQNFEKDNLIQIQREHHLAQQK